MKEDAKAQRLNLAFSASDRDVVFKRYNNCHEKDDDDDCLNKGGRTPRPPRGVLKQKVGKPLTTPQVQTMANDAFRLVDSPTNIERYSRYTLQPETSEWEYFSSALAEVLKKVSKRVEPENILGNMKDYVNKHGRESLLRFENPNEITSTSFILSTLVLSF